MMAVMTPLSVPISADQQTSYHIPFSFSVNGMTLPAGVYAITTGDPMVLVRGAKAGAVAITGTLHEYGENGGRAVFVRNGDSYVLIEVWVGPNGRRLPAPRWDGERDLASRGGTERIVIRARAL
jgi:hypothetical protein